jgi:hypothetical protein
VEIGGITHSFLQWLYSDNFDITSANALYATSDVFQMGASMSYVQAGIISTGLLLPTNLETPFSVTSGDFNHKTLANYFKIYDYDPLLGYYHDTYANLDLQSATVSIIPQTPDVPLPAALPLLVSAMGGAGWMARRRTGACA